MEIQLIWKTKLFNSKYEIFRNETMIGELKNESWSRTSLGELNGKKYMFVTRGILNQDTQITDLKDDSNVGKILFSNWKTKTTIIYENKNYIWRYDNFLNTKWSISDEDRALVNYHSSAFDGNISAVISDEPLILAGLFIRNYIRKHSD